MDTRLQDNLASNQPRATLSYPLSYDVVYKLGNDNLMDTRLQDYLASNQPRATLSYPLR
ncbi:hypothetical protein J6590_081873 [Homalodisca vitripennis]|nr:hypothetical protein J6590_081873 [Homalodisca vitripennis]